MSRKPTTFFVVGFCFILNLGGDINSITILLYHTFSIMLYKKIPLSEVQIKTVSN